MKLFVFIFVLLNVFFAANAVCCPRTQMYWASENCSPYETDYYMGGGNEGDISGLILPNRCKAKVCGDGKVVKNGFWCGKGPCNSFGCSCTGGCIEGDATENFKRLTGIQDAAGGAGLFDPSTW